MVTRHPVWELIFLMVILKIPIVYLCVVVYYAIKAEPRPEEGAAVTAQLGGGDSGGGWRRSVHPPRHGPRPHGGPARAPRPPRTAVARRPDGRTPLAARLRRRHDLGGLVLPRAHDRGRGPDAALVAASPATKRPGNGRSRRSERGLCRTAPRAVPRQPLCRARRVAPAV